MIRQTFHMLIAMSSTASPCPAAWLNKSVELDEARLSLVQASPHVCCGIKQALSKGVTLHSKAVEREDGDCKNAGAGKLICQELTEGSARAVFSR